MSDSIRSESWWQSRIDEIKSQGFDTKNIVNELERNVSQASTIIEQYEKDFLLANTLKDEINDLPNRLEIERISLLNQLKLIENSNDVQNELRSLIRRHLPWKSAAKSNKILWDSTGNGEKLNLIVKRLDSLDSSMVPYISEILFLFEIPEKFDELNKKINDIEKRQSERIATLDSMASLLSEHGFEIHGFSDLNLEERFHALEELQVLDDKHVQLERRINRTIGRFDANTASDYNRQRLLLTKTRSEIELNALIERINRAENDFLIRLENINNQFSKWIHEGFKLNVHIPILADELLQRETQIDNFAQNISEYKQVWNRLEYQLSIWPEEHAVTQIEFGTLSEKNEIKDFVIELEKRSALVEEEVRANITRWKNKGFELIEIEALTLKNPRLAQNEMINLGIIFEKTIEAKNELNNLDLTFVGEEKRTKWNEMITKKTPDKTTIDELLNWISKIKLRNKRHRRMLENEWLNLNYTSEINTENLTLLEFENLIKNTEGASPSVRYKSVKSLKERLVIELGLWLDNLENDNWNIEDLILLKNENPNELMKLKNEINYDISEYERLVMRLKNLPWNRNIPLAKEVLFKLKKPNLLKEIKSLIPQYMQILAGSDQKHHTTEFKFEPWLPNKKSILINENEVIPPPEIIIQEQSDIKNENIPVPEIIVEEKSEIKKEREIKSKNKKIIPLEENREINEMIKEIKTQKHQPTLEEWENYTRSLTEILIQLGISKDFDLSNTTNLDSLSHLRKTLAKFVGITPRDLRVDRLLRILLRVIPINLPENISLNDLANIIGELTLCAKRLNKWTTKRLERRHNNSTKKLLNDSKQLGEVLIRIPSPGFAIPLVSDNYDLPSINNLQELKNEINNLKKYIL